MLISVKYIFLNVFVFELIEFGIFCYLSSLVVLGSWVIDWWKNNGDSYGNGNSNGSSVYY